MGTNHQPDRFDCVGCMVCFDGDAMIAFIHRETIEQRAKTVTLKATPYERKQLAPTTHRLHRFDYLIGEMQPNYPMPAIRYKAEILPDRVILWERIGLWSFKYLALTI